MAEPTQISVHRCRFVDYLPAAITALAFPPVPLPSIKGKNKSTKTALKFGTLAIGRANGSIELAEWTGSDPVNPAPQAWAVTKTLSGPFPSKVDSLAFTIRFPEQLSSDDVPSLPDLRLFSTGGGSELIEWDLGTGCVKRTLNSQGGSIWSIAPNPSSNTLALGCEDGSVRLVSIADDELSFLRKFDRVKSRLLSIAWGPPTPRQAKAEQMGDSSDDEDDEDDEDDWLDSWLVTGCSDSSLRKWDLATGRVAQKMSTDKVRGERTLVWTVGVLGDGTIVSGDSLGMVKFWDSKTCTQLHSFQAHNADVLCLTVSPEGTALYTSGVDQKIIQFSFVKTSSKSTSLHSPNRWVQSSSRRMHSHDVRSLATWPPYTPLPPSHKHQFPLNIAPILASGGLDMSVVLTPAAISTSTTVTKVINPLGTSTVSTFDDSYHRKLGYATGFAGVGKIRLARQARLVLAAQDESVSVWRVLEKKKPADDDENQDEEVGGGWEKVLDMDLNVHTNIAACDISDDGRWVAISDWYETKLFHLETSKSGELKPTRIRDFSSLFQLPNTKQPVPTGASALKFSPDSKKLVVCTAISSFVVIFDLGSPPSDEDSEGTKPRVIRTFDHHRIRNVVLGDRIISGGPVQTDDDQDEDMEPASDVDEDMPHPTSSTLNTPITRITMSQDVQWLVTSDDTRRVHVFNLDSMQHHAVLPTFSHPIQALSFDPSSPNILVLGLANNTIHVYDVESRSFPAWSAEVCANLPKRFTHVHDPILGLTFDPKPQGAGRRALFWGSTWMCSVKLDAPVGWGGFSKKRRRQSASAGLPPSYANPAAKQQVHVHSDDSRQQQNFTMITHYRPILMAEFLSAGGELVVVERPLVDVLNKLPPAYFKPKYGAS